MPHTIYLLLLLCLGSVPRISGLYDASGGPVELLTADSFQQEVTEGSGVWMVNFYAPWGGHCKSLVPEWEKAAKALDGVVHVAAVDGTEQKELAAKFDVTGFPTILVFGSDKAKPEQYKSARTADAITTAGLKAAEQMVKGRLSDKKPSSSSSGSSSSGGSSSGSGSSGSGSGSGGDDVIELTGDNFNAQVLDSNDPWLVEFFAPWCGHCKNLAPEWAQAATELKGSFKLGAVDATQHQDLASKYEVRGYPTIKFFPPGEKEEPKEYDGGRTASAIVEWSVHKLDEYGVGPEVVEAVNQDAIQSSCFSKKICVVAVLPHLIDTGAKGRQDYINTVVEVAKKLRALPMAFVWMQGAVQTKFEETFGISFNYPTMVAISGAKLRYAGHKGAFATESLTKFLKDVYSGRQRTVAFKAMPELKAAEAWDGEDYVPPPEDEDEL